MGDMPTMDTMDTHMPTIMVTTMARGPLMLNPRLLLKLSQRLRLMLTMDTTDIPLLMPHHGYYGHHLGYAHHGYYGYPYAHVGHYYGKRSADAEPAADAGYLYGHYGYGHLGYAHHGYYGYPYAHHYGHYYGKRSADAEADAGYLYGHYGYGRRYYGHGYAHHGYYGYPYAHHGYYGYHH